MSKVKVGDTIEHEIYGIGMIEFISSNIYSKLPVKAYFEERQTMPFLL